MRKCQKNKKPSCVRFTILAILFVILAVLYVHKSLEMYRLTGKDEIRDVLLKSAIEQYSQQSESDGPTQNKEILKQVKSEGERQAVIRGFISKQINELQGGRSDTPVIIIEPKDASASDVNTETVETEESPKEEMASEASAVTMPASAPRRPEQECIDGRPPPHHMPLSPPPH